MYEQFEKLLREKGVKTSDVSRATGLSSTFFSEWKKGKSKNPKPENLQKIANFFGVSVEYLMTGKDNRLSERNADIDYQILTNDEVRNMTIEFCKLNENHKKMLLKYLEFLKADKK